MTYRQALKQKCKCGKFLVGGWSGDKKMGKPLFSRVSSPRLVAPNIMMVEEHTINACFSPHQIA